VGSRFYNDGPSITHQIFQCSQNSRGPPPGGGKKRGLASQHWGRPSLPDSFEGPKGTARRTTAISSRGRKPARTMRPPTGLSSGILVVPTLDASRLSGRGAERISSRRTFSALSTLFFVTEGRFPGLPPPSEDSASRQLRADVFLDLSPRRSKFRRAPPHCRIVIRCYLCLSCGITTSVFAVATLPTASVQDTKTV